MIVKDEQLDGITHVDPDNPQEIMTRLAQLEGALAHWTPKLAECIFKAKEAKGMLDRELSRHRSHALANALVKSKAAADVYADEKVFGDVKLGELAADYITVDARAAGLRVTVEALDKRASIMQSLLKRHNEADGRHAGRGS